MDRLLALFISKVKSLFLRSLSFSSRIEYSTISRKAKIWGKCKVFNSAVGDYTYVGCNCRIVHAHIGKFCSIARDCAIGMGSHPLDNISTSSIFTSKKNGTCQVWTKKNLFTEYKDVIIGNDVWIGQRVMIMPGVRIGNGAVIGAGAVVTKDVQPYSIVGGVPASFIRFRFPEESIQKLDESKWWDLDEEVLIRNISIFQNTLMDKSLEQLMNLCHK